MSLQLLTTWLISGSIESSLLRMGRFGEEQSSINWVRVCSSRVSKMVQVGKNLSTTLRNSGRTSMKLKDHNSYSCHIAINIVHYDASHTCKFCSTRIITIDVVLHDILL